MLKPQVHHHHKTTSPPLSTRGNKPFFSGDGGVDGSRNPTSFLSHNTLAFLVKRPSHFRSRSHSGNSAGQIKAVAGQSSVAGSAVKTISLRAVITVQLTVGGVLSNLSTRPFDDFADLLGKSLLLELVAAETDPSMCTN